MTVPFLRPHTLWNPVNCDLSLFEVEIDNLEREYTDLVIDPERVSDDPRARFNYKMRLNLWYHLTMPTTKRDILRRVKTYWTTSGAGRDWINHYREELISLTLCHGETVVSLMQLHIDRLDAMELHVTRMFVDMKQMMMLNPDGVGAEQDRFFLEDGPVVKYLVPKANVLFF